MDHYWHQLAGPRWFSGALIFAQQVAEAADAAVFVELGAWKGRSAACMGVEIANSGKRIDFHSVDHWRGTAGESAHESDPDLRAGTLYECYLRNIQPVAAYVKPLKADSAGAASHFPDGSVDFLYVDADHTEQAVLRDLAAWWPKLKPGAVIAGDDWCFKEPGTEKLGVRQAVLSFCGRHGVPAHVLPGFPVAAWQQWLVRKPSA
jgi:hypothetical protein